jgi:hypothetical protein
MNMSMYWRMQAAANAALAAAQADDVRERDDIMADGRLTPNERARLLAPIERRLRERYEEHERATAARHAQVSAAYEAAKPEAQLARAVMDGPERADTFLRLFAGASPRQLVEFAARVVADGDLRGAWALRRAVAGDDVPAEISEAVHKQLTVLTAATERVAKAGLYAFLVESRKARDETKPFDPAALLGAANEDARFEDQTLTSREARELLDLAGVPQPEPSEAVAE